jgi:hypothetical protein
MKQHLLVTTAAISLAFSAATFAQSTPSAPAAQKSAAQQCKDLTGAALETCLQAAPGRSGDAASREGGRTPGASESAASRSGAAPGKEKSGTDATGGTSGGSATGKGAAKSY